MTTKNENLPPQPAAPVPEVAAGAPGSAVWCFAANDDEEVWQYGGTTREAAIAAGYLELSKWTDEPEDRTDFCVAPTKPATQQDVEEYTGDEEIEVDWPMIDMDRIEYIPYPPPPNA
jgi:hypothetical protein